MDDLIKKFNDDIKVKKPYDLQDVGSQINRWVEDRKHEILIAWWAKYGFDVGKAAIVSGPDGISVKEAAGLCKCPHCGGHLNAACVDPLEPKDEISEQAKKLVRSIIRDATYNQYVLTDNAGRTNQAAESATPIVKQIICFFAEMIIDKLEEAWKNEKSN